ncbi:MAG TPA: hypothetical protein QF873_01925 [Patescibacteria group bacterium]|nr:hypothetical protein [Patescibacteria group bacterium]|tara:strand:+ start:164 stop:364 length:201 start_codon:yes stop_codon:yes gene_type:complete
MKTMECDLCDATTSGETLEDWMMALMPHYKEAHADVISAEGKAEEEMGEGKKKWMAENKARYDAAE